MPVLVPSNMDDNAIKNEKANMETPFSHYNYVFGNNFETHGQL